MKVDPDDLFESGWADWHASHVDRLLMENNYYRGGWFAANTKTPTFSRWSDNDGPLTNEAAMAEIHELLDRKEWSPDTLDEIANIVRRTGREIRDCNE
jgi:hypothetical protein